MNLKESSNRFILNAISSTFLCTVLLGIVPSTALASLLQSYQYTGYGNWSLDAVGARAYSSILNAQVPAGSTIEKAYLYAASTGFTGHIIPDGGVSLEGTPLTWDTSAFNNISSYNQRTDVTDIVSNKVGSNGGTFDFAVTEQFESRIDGVALAVVYSNTNEAYRSIGFFDGVQSTVGDTLNILPAVPLDLTLPGFEFLLSVGITYSAQGRSQYSRIDVDGRRLTTSAGGEDDGVASNGALITLGGIGDSTDNPADPNAFPNGERSDDELYNLATGNRISSLPYVDQGDDEINIFILNEARDDNIFFAGYNYVSVKAEPIPEPATLALISLGLAGLVHRRRKQVKAA